MIGIVSMALVSFGRGYQKFSVTAVQERSSFTAMQTLSTHLRSAQSVVLSEQLEKFDLESQELRLYVTDENGPKLESWKVRDKRLYLDERAVGSVESVVLRVRSDHYLEVTVDKKQVLIDWRDVLAR